MVTPTTIALAVGVAVALLAGIAERLHAARVRRVARLAFGPHGAPAAWAQTAPTVRVVGLALCAWGATVLAMHDPTAGDAEPAETPSKRLLIALDVSPSMLVEDAGPDLEKVSRSAWAGKVVQGILDRLDMRETRISVVAFYTGALTVLEDTTDRNVITNMFDGLRLHVAFKGGATDLASGVNESLKIAQPWPRDSTTLVVVSDGDSSGTLGPTRVPPAIADTIVIGVGDPVRATVVSGHSSRQETWSLRQLAARLGGHYHEGNRLHLPSDILRSLTMIAPKATEAIGMRELALIAIGIGAAATALIGPALLLLGVPRSHAAARTAGSASLSISAASAGSAGSAGSAAPASSGVSGREPSAARSAGLAAVPSLAHSSHERANS